APIASPPGARNMGTSATVLYTRPEESSLGLKLTLIFRAPDIHELACTSKNPGHRPRLDRRHDHGAEPIQGAQTAGARLHSGCARPALGAGIAGAHAGSRPRDRSRYCPWRAGLGQTLALGQTIATQRLSAGISDVTQPEIRADPLVRPYSAAHGLSWRATPRHCQRYA